MIPADSIAVVLEPASPLPPEMMAPAWPMRRPRGAVTPGDESDHRLLAAPSLMNWGGVFLGRGDEIEVEILRPSFASEFSRSV